MVVILAAQLMVVLDFSIVNVALPSIQRDVAFSPSGVQWVVTAYAIAFGGLLMLGGRAGDVLVGGGSSSPVPPRSRSRRSSAASRVPREGSWRQEPRRESGRP
jgi:MFS family permease